MKSANALILILTADADIDKTTERQQNTYDMLKKRLFIIMGLLAVCCADAEVSEHIADKHGRNLTEEQIEHNGDFAGFLFTA